MPELRKDAVTDRWVVIATERSKRPHEFGRRREQVRRGVCPFCYGNESMTPPEIMAYRPYYAPNQEGWEVRVVPNKFPALRIEGNLDPGREVLYDRMNGVGAHEVIIESPQHNSSLGTHRLEQMEKIIWALRDRLVDLKRDIRLKYIQIFKNEGAEAGASLEHPHFQLIATPVIPQQISQELEGARRFFREKQQCVYCAMVDVERQMHERLVDVSPHFVAFCPYASRFPYEIWIVPRRHSHDFGDIQVEEVQDLAKVLKLAIRRLEVALENPPYNLVLHSAPNEGGYENYYHWHLEIVPRLTAIAGFELGTGYYINPTSPEVAAGIIKNVQVPLLQ